MASKLDINDVHPNIFAVNNVDDVSVANQAQDRDCKPKYFYLVILKMKFDEIKQGKPLFLVL